MSAELCFVPDLGFDGCDFELDVLVVCREGADGGELLRCLCGLRGLD